MLTSIKIFYKNVFSVTPTSHIRDVKKNDEYEEQEGEETQEAQEEGNETQEPQEEKEEEETQEKKEEEEVQEEPQKKTVEKQMNEGGHGHQCIWNRVTNSIQFNQMNISSFYACMSCRAKSKVKDAIRFPDGTEWVTISLCPSCVWKNRNLASLMAYKK